MPLVEPEYPPRPRAGRKYATPEEAREALRAQQRAWYRRNRERVIAQTRAWQAANPERVQASAEARRARRGPPRPTGRPRIYADRRAKWEAWRRRNPGLSSARAVASRIGPAMPPWADQKAIEEIYAEAARLTAETGFTYSVDHIVPRKHPDVCGLHVPWNLRVIPLLDNIRKGNRTP